jgi:uncharacterized protein YqgC (DUF456 family)
MTILMWILAVVFVAVGFAGVVLPALPGAMLIYAGLFLAAWADGFVRVGPIPLAAIGIIGLSSYGIDFLASALGTRKMGASPRAMVGAGVGTLAGLFFGLPGLVIGPFVGAAVGERSVRQDFLAAGRAGVAAWIGFALGTVAKVGAAFLMVAIFAGAWFLF